MHPFYTSGPVCRAPISARTFKGLRLGSGAPPSVSVSVSVSGLGSGAPPSVSVSVSVSGLGSGAPPSA